MPDENCPEYCTIRQKPDIWDIGVPFPMAKCKKKRTFRTAFLAHKMLLFGMGDPYAEKPTQLNLVAPVRQGRAL